MAPLAVVRVRAQLLSPAEQPLHCSVQQALLRECTPIGARNGRSITQLQHISNPAIGSRFAGVLGRQGKTDSKSSFLYGLSCNRRRVGADTNDAQLSAARRSANRTLPVRATAPQEEEPVSSNTPDLLVARRQVLAAGGATAAGLLLPSQGQAAPIVLRPADLAACADDCCVNIRPNGIPPRVPFTPLAGPVRTRKATGNLTTQERRMFNRAYQLLRQKAREDPTDPRWYLQQAHVHCAYCNELYQYSFQGARYPLQVHSSWLFLPWHRLYLHFHERILISLLKTDPEFASQADSFALPFWNYDALNAASPDCRTPQIYVDQTGLPFLYDSTRSEQSKSTLVSFNRAAPTLPAAQVISDNTATMRAQIFQATTANLFFGNPLRAGDPLSRRRPGQLEISPHNPVHVWVGGNMGQFGTAGQDPIFYGHHGNLDRLWSVWLTLPGGNRRNFVDPDWLGASFLFFDENRNLVEAKVSDAINTQASLRYAYEDVPIPWATAPAPAPRNFAPSQRRLLAVDEVTQKLDSLGPATSASPAVQLNKEPLVISSVPRSPPSDLGAGRNPGAVAGLLRSSGVSGLARRAGIGALTVPDFQEEVLVLQGVSYPSDQPAHFNVFINLPDATPNTPLDCAQYAGSFTTVPMGMMMSQTMTSEVDVRISISSVLESLGLTDSSDFGVTIVPAAGEGSEFGDVSIKGVAIEYDS
ncbi:hypothetical protein KFL_000720100 [Klebsormidium nitens]|uniref:Tyrosinase copper-binding domain-containing protein n=1 Tax=Klebsormidium nitens TaxID=105231 RepID=A0A1Y1HVY3_KLENI|nr:hypothetical protein KFL_000720100 [Klebsormidium nitens]|eukprot:GAQ81141.1 hypothetical protein KFL_000720100 [Klebsormidium nitens]